MTAHSNPTPPRGATGGGLSRLPHAELKSVAASPASAFGSPTPSSDSDPSAISTEQATVFLKLGIAGPRRPVDDLIERLHDSNALQWLNNALLTGPLTALTSANAPENRAIRYLPIDLLAQGQATLEQCSAIKEKSKKIVKHATSPNERLAGIAGYFISLATALRYHDVLLTTHGRDDLAGIFLDLAEVAPEPYATLLSEAALAHTGERFEGGPMKA